MIKTVNPTKGIIPVHTTYPENFQKLDIRKYELIYMKDGGEYDLGSQK